MLILTMTAIAVALVAGYTTCELIKKHNLLIEVEKIWKERK